MFRQHSVATAIALVFSAMLITHRPAWGAAMPAETVQSTGSASAVKPDTSVAATLVRPSGFGAPKWGPFALKAGIKSNHASGRLYEAQEKKSGRTYKLKNEYYLGFDHQSSGWGFSALAVTNGVSYNDSSKNSYGAGDPSLTLVHPAFYSDRGLKVSGQLRRYLAVTDRSRDRALAQWAYYLYANSKLDQGITVFNQLTPRYFDQSYYKAADSKYLLESYTTITKTVNPWFKYGIGQHSQIEWHAETSTGTCVEIYPMANFTISSNIFIEPRLVLPIHKVNAVYDSPRAVALDNAQAELYLNLSI